MTHKPSPNNSTVDFDSQIYREQQDLRYMGAAIRYGRRNLGITGTNPSVACLIVCVEDNRRWIAGRGVTAAGGRPHAEPLALREAGANAKGATAYITLEPCAHHGVTLPCASALIEAGVARVVTAQLDPDTRVNSKGLRMLRDAGVEVIENIGIAQANWALRGYLSRKSLSRPWVVLKIAVTSDGFMGIKGHGQVAITGPIANAQTHMLRARSDAILIGSGTVLSDDPSLDCRLPGLHSRSPIRIVLENSKPIPHEGNFIRIASKIDTFIACPQQSLDQRQRDLAGTSCKFLACDTINGTLALPELLGDLADIGVSSLLVEGGSKVAAGFLDNQLVDEIIYYVSCNNMARTIKANGLAMSDKGNWIKSHFGIDEMPPGFRYDVGTPHRWQFGPDTVHRLIRC